MSNWAEVPSVHSSDAGELRYHMGAEAVARLVEEMRELRLRNIELTANLELTRRKLALYKDYETEVETSLANIIASAFDLDRGRSSVHTVGPDKDESGVASQEAIEAALTKERQRIAQSIHDGMSQQITGIILELEACHRLLVSHHESQAETRLVKAIRTARSALADIRNYMFSLRTPSPGQMGLIPTLERMVADFEQRSVIPARLRVFGTIKQLSPDAEEALLRVAQETLMNVSKHAQASQVEVSLRFGPSSLELCISDDGVGFDVERAMARTQGDERLGIIGMKERIAAEDGVLSIDSAPGTGTRVVAQLPLINHVTESKYYGAEEGGGGRMRPDATVWLPRCRAITRGGIRWWEEYGYYLSTTIP